MPNRSSYRAFTKSYHQIVRKLVAPVGVLPSSPTGTAVSGKPIDTAALWDTGATRSCIQPTLANRLGTRINWASSPTTFAGVGGTVRASFILVSIFITPNFELEGCPVYVLDFPGSAGILIGMDIITQGDFVVCDTEKKTSFSFVVPPFPNRIDFAEQVDAAQQVKWG